jgi:hypothetical protein
MNIFKILLYTHILFGSISLLVGLYVLLTKKGDKIHRKIGNIFYFSMLISSLISLPMAIMHPNYFLFAVGIFTLYLLLISLESLLLLADVLNRLDDFDAILKPIENLEAIEKLFSDKTRS